MTIFVFKLNTQNFYFKVTCQDMRILYLSGIKPTSSNPIGGIFISKQIAELSQKINHYRLVGLETGFSKHYPGFLDFSRKNLNVNTVSWDLLNVRFGLFSIIGRKIVGNLHLLKLANQIEHLYNVSDYDLIHAHWAHPSGTLARILSVRKGIPYIITLHGSDIHTRPQKNRDILKQTLHTLENAQKAIFVSHSLLETAKSFGYSGKNSMLIYNGVDRNIFYPKNPDKAREETNIQKNTSLVGFTGNLEKVKGADLLPEIFEEIKKQKPEAQFIIIGDGSLKEEITTKCREKKLSVHFTGRVNYERLPFFLSLMDVLLLPSRNEGFGAIAIEAASCGTPVVARNQGGLIEAIGNAGILIEENNFIENAAESSVKLLNNTINQNILLDHAAKFSINQNTQKYLELYNNVISNK